MMWDWHGYSWWWFVAMPLGMLGFWALVAWVAVAVMRGDRATPPAAAPTERVLDLGNLGAEPAPGHRRARASTASTSSATTKRPASG